jgi:regulator of nucleoside diphosphate kinase
MPDISTGALPRIVISLVEEQCLTAMATGASERIPEVAAVLLRELERAELVPDDEMPSDVIRLDSVAEVELDQAKSLTLQLVLPAEADISAGKVSILTPIGAALLGLSPGQEMQWSGNDGRHHQLTVRTVSNSPRA